MTLHSKAFWVMSFFLGGVLIYSIFYGANNALFFALLTGTLLAVILIGFGRYMMGILALTLLVGSIYAHIYNQNQLGKFTAPYDTSIDFTAIVERVSRGDQSQSVDVQLTGEYAGKIRIYFREYPVLAYGDTIQVAGGQLKPIPEDRMILEP